VLPSGVSPNVAYALHREHGGEDCLQTVDMDVVRGLMEELGGDELIQFVPVEYAHHAQTVFDGLNIGSLGFQNVWLVFQAMLPLM